MTILSTELQTPHLAELDFCCYLDKNGHIPNQYSKVVGIYAIFDEDKCLQFVGYSRDVSMSLRQHLVRCPEFCHWFKIQAIDRPKRSILEAIQTLWLEENGDCPPGNGPNRDCWTQPIDATLQMTSDEQALYGATTSEAEQAKVLKNIARRVEGEVKAVLEARGVKESLRFDPKLKEQGVLSIKPAK